jgi:hypothetical protein
MSFRYIYIQRAGFELRFELSYGVQGDCNIFSDDGFKDFAVDCLKTKLG